MFQVFMPRFKHFIGPLQLNARASVNYLAPPKLNADLWVIRLRYDKDGELELANSEPCISCLAAVLKYGIRRVFYSKEDGSIGIINPKKHTTDYASHAQKTCGVHTNWSL